LFFLEKGAPDGGSLPVEPEEIQLGKAYGRTALELLNTML